MSNIIIKNSGNPITIVFSGDVDLTQFTKVIAQFKNDIRNSIDNPESVEVLNSTELELNFQDTTEAGVSDWVIKGVNPLYPDSKPFILTNNCLNNLTSTKVCE